MTAVGGRVEDPQQKQLERELTELARSSEPPQKFFPQFLQRLMHATGAVAGAVWGLNQQGLLARLGDAGLAEIGLAQSTTAARRHIQMLLHVLHSGQAEIRQPGGAPNTQSPTGHFLLLAPLRHENNCVGVLELFLSEQSTDQQVAEQLQTLEEWSGCATRYLQGQARIAAESDTDSFYHQLASFLLQLHRDSSLKQVALTAVNEGRLLVGCDRAAVAALQGNRLRVLGISGQDRVVRRSNLVRSMTELCSLVQSSGRPLRYTGELDGLPPQVERPLVSYLGESQARYLEAVPLCAPSSAGTPAKPNHAPAFGVLLVEHFADAEPKSRSQELATLAQHVELALHNSLVHDRRWLSPPWGRPNKRALAEPGRRKLMSPALAVAVAVVAVMLLALIPVPYRIEAQGRLMPVEQHAVFAPEDGHVVDVLVQSGQRVTQDQSLLRLRNEALVTEILLARNRLREKEQQLAALSAESDETARSMARGAAIRLRGRISQTQIEIHGIQRRLAYLEQEQARLEVRSKASGTLATFQPGQQLLNRPVRRGELLLEVINEEGPWQLELDVPAHRVGQMTAAQQASAGDRLAVRYVLATMPERTFDGVVRRMATRTTSTADGSAMVQLDVDVDAPEILERTAGAEVLARIECGRRCLAYVLLGDVYDFLRRRICSFSRSHPAMDSGRAFGRFAGVAHPAPASRGARVGVVFPARAELGGIVQTTP